MTGIIVVFSRIENAKSIRNVLVRNGFTVAAACTTGAQALSLLEDYNEALVICGGRLADMMCVELADLLPEGVKLLAVASPDFLGAIGREDIVCLSTPLKVNELCEHGGHDLPDAGAGEAKTQAEAQKTGRGRPGSDPSGQGASDGAEPDDGGGSAQVSAEMQHGQRKQHGGDCEDGPCGHAFLRQKYGGENESRIYQAAGLRQ